MSGKSPEGLRGPIPAIQSAFEWPVRRWSAVGDHTFFEASDFPWVRPLEAGWRTIRAELDSLLQEQQAIPRLQDIVPGQTRLTRGDMWKAFHFYGYGYRFEGNCQRCPETVRLIEAVPGMRTAFFSILAPGAHLPPHRGPYKGVLRYHLGLIVPEPTEECRIRVEQDVAHWEEGKSLVFDDSFEHEVWNGTRGDRVVLFLDVVRPMVFPGSVYNNLVIALIGLSPFVQLPRWRQRRWNRRKGGPGR